MRSIFQTTIPSLRSRLYRPPETDDEFYGVQAAVSSTIEEEWNWAEAEERLKKAYEEGGITVWAQTALRELEAETRVERSKRNREQEAVLVSEEKDPSLNQSVYIFLLYEFRSLTAILCSPIIYLFFDTHGYDEKKSHSTHSLLLMFSLAAFLCPIVTAGFQEPLYWEIGLNEGMYNLQSEPIF